MQPSNIASWNDFKARQSAHPEDAAAAIESQLAASIEHVKAVKAAPKKPRKPVPEPEPEPPATLADLLRQAVALAITRHGRAPREQAVREETLLEVLSDAMRRTQ